MAAERQQQEEAEAALEREAEEFKKQLPRGFHDVLVNVARSVILHQPKDPLLYCAQFLEAEIDRRVLSDLAYCESPSLIASSAIAQAVQQVQKPALFPLPTQSPHPPIFDTDDVAKRTLSPGPLFLPVHPDVTSFSQASSPRGRDFNVGDVPLLVAHSPGHSPHTSQHLIYPADSVRCVSQPHQQQQGMQATSPQQTQQQQQQVIAAPSPVAVTKSNTSARIATVAPSVRPAEEQHQQQVHVAQGDGAHVQDAAKPDEDHRDHTASRPSSPHDELQQQRQQQAMAAQEPIQSTQHQHSPQHESTSQQQSPAHEPTSQQQSSVQEPKPEQQQPTEPEQSSQTPRRKSKTKSSKSRGGGLCCWVDVVPQQPPQDHQSPQPSQQPGNEPHTTSAAASQDAAGIHELPPSSDVAAAQTKAIVRLDQTMEISAQQPDTAAAAATGKDGDDELVVSVDYKVTAVYDTHTGEVQTTAVVTSDEQPDDMGRVQLNSVMQASVSLSRVPLFDISGSHPSKTRPVYETSSSLPVNYVPASPEDHSQGHPNQGKTEAEVRFDGYLHTGIFQQPAGPCKSEPEWKNVTPSEGQGQTDTDISCDECVPCSALCGFATPLKAADSGIQVAQQQQQQLLQLLQQQQKQLSGHTYCPFAAATLHPTSSQAKQLAGDADNLVQSAVYTGATVGPSPGAGGSLRQRSVSRTVNEEHERALMQDQHDPGKVKDKQQLVATTAPSAPASSHGLHSSINNTLNKSLAPCSSTHNPSQQHQQQPADAGVAREAHSTLLNVSSSNPNAMKSPFEISSSYPVNYVPPSPESHTGKTQTEVRFEGYLHTGTFQPPACQPHREPAWTSITAKQSSTANGLPAETNTVCGFASPAAAASRDELVTDNQQQFGLHQPVTGSGSAAPTAAPFCPFTAASLQPTPSQATQLAGDADSLVKSMQESRSTAQTTHRETLRQSSISRAVNEEYERALLRESRNETKTPRPHPQSISRTTNEVYERHLSRDEAAHHVDMAAGHPEPLVTVAAVASQHPASTSPASSVSPTSTLPIVSPAFITSPDTAAASTDAPLIYGHYGNQWPRTIHADYENSSPQPNDIVYNITAFPTGITPMTFGHYSAFASVVSFN